MKRHFELALLIALWGGCSGGSAQNGTRGTGGEAGRGSGGISGTGGAGGSGSGGKTGSGGAAGTATGGSGASGGASGTSGTAGATTGAGGSGASAPPSNLTLSLVAGVRGGLGDVDGTGAAARFDSLSGVATDRAGNIYVADTGNRTIRKVVVATGVVTTLAGTAGMFGSAEGVGAAARFAQVKGVAADLAGNLFVADFGNCVIRKIVLATGAVTTFAGVSGACGNTDGAAAIARFEQPWALMTDGAGNLFVTDRNMIRRIIIATGAVTTLAGSIAGGSADGTGPLALFKNPFGLATDGAGNLFVVDQGNYTIRKVVIATGVVTTIAGSPEMAGSTDAVGAAARFSYPNAMASDGAGNLFVSDGGNCAIRKVEIASAAVSTLASCRVISNGTGTTADLGAPEGVAYDGTGNLFVTEANGVIRKIVIDTGAVSPLAGAWGRGNTDGPAAGPRFYYPTGMASDGAGNLYVSDQGNWMIRKIALATGAVTTLAGSPGSSGSVDGTGAAARFNSPGGMTTDGAGNLIVVDQAVGTIRKVVLATGVVTTLAGTPVVQVAGTTPGWSDGIGAAAQFNLPSDVTSDGAGNVYVTDRGNKTIRKVVVATGAVTTLAGSPGVAGGADGTGAAARFDAPWGIASDGAGGLFVGDYTTVRKVVIATGAVTTLAGSPGMPGDSDGTGAAARFNAMKGLAVDGTGNLFVVDSLKKTVRKVVLATGVVTTLVGSPGAPTSLGPLPAGLGEPRGLAMGSAGELFISDENAILVVK